MVFLRLAVIVGCALLFGASPSSAADARLTVLITGANRGIGLAFAKIYAERGYRVIATARDPAKANALQELAGKHKLVSVEKLDVTDFAQIDALAAKLKGTPIDLLVNNAGVSGGVENQMFGTINYRVFDDVFRTNVAGPLKMSEAFFDNVLASHAKKLVVVTSSQGSLTERGSTNGSGYFYRASKSAVNMEMRNLASAVKEKGVMVCLVAPGATDTDFMASAHGKIKLGDPKERTVAMVGLIDQCTMERSGISYEYDGRVIPW